MTRTRAALLAQGAVSAAAVVAVGWWASRQHLPALPSGPHAIGLLLGATAIYAAATLLRCERWHRLLASTGIASRRADAYGLVAIGYTANNTLPARAGDVLKAAMTATVTGAGAARIVGVAVGERVLDALALIALFVTAGALNAHGGFVGATTLLHGAAIAGAAGAALGVALVLGRRLRPVVAARRQIAAAARPLRPLLGVRGLALFGLSVALWLLEATVYLVVGRAVGVGLDLTTSVEIVTLVNVVGLIPAAPASLGTFDAAVVFATRGLATGGTAIVFVLALRLVLFVPITLVGLVVLLARHGGIGRLRTLRPLTTQA